MALSHIPGLRFFGQEADEVDIRITVTGRRAREVAAALARNVQAPSEVISISIGVPGLDKITGGILIDTEASINRGFEETEMTFTIAATVEETDG